MKAADAQSAHVFMLLSDAYGGFGGISQYNRDFLDALCSLPAVASAEALPRIAEPPIGKLPPKLRFRLGGVGGIARYSLASLWAGLTGPRPDLVICGHLNLLPLCALIARARGARLAMLIFGIEAWHPTSRAYVNALTGCVDLVVSISQVTLDRYLAWARPPRLGAELLPNAIHLSDYAPGPKAADLVEQFGLAGRKVVMTFGRMAGRERAKGFDRMLESFGAIRARAPEAVYLLAGKGDDADRLRQKANDLGLGDAVVFTGMVPEERKADYFRLADVYAMPSRGEGFGFVILEAMACGIPVVASRIDGGFEAIREGALGIAVDPNNPAELQDAVIAALDQPKRIPDGLEYFSFPRFVDRAAGIVDRLLAGTRGGRDGR